MARRKRSTRRRSTAVTAPRKRARRMGAVKASRRRRMGAVGGKMGSELGNVAQLAVGALGAGVVYGLVEKALPASLTSGPNAPYVKGAVLVLGGVLVAQKMPKARFVGYGMATAGAVVIGQKLLAGTGLLNGSRRNLPPGALKQIADDVRAGGMRYGIGTGSKASTLNRGTPVRQGVIVGARGYDVSEEYFSE